MWNQKARTKLGDFELELLDYSNAPVTPDSRMMERAAKLLACLPKEETSITNLVFAHYQQYCKEHPEWMIECGVPLKLSVESLGSYIYGLVAYVALDEGDEFEGFLIHPNWESEHKITLEYNNGILEVQS